jgi:L-methionine (R)-S-oxide reductase
VVDLEHPGQLILGPFHGKVACQTIKIGKGVCGTVAQEGRTRLLEDVETFPDHIACDGEDKSEIVAPIKVADKVSLILFPGRKVFTVLWTSLRNTQTNDCWDAM